MSQKQPRLKCEQFAGCQHDDTRLMSQCLVATELAATRHARLPMCTTQKYGRDDCVDGHSACSAVGRCRDSVRSLACATGRGPSVSSSGPELRGAFDGISNW